MRASLARSRPYDPSASLARSRGAPPSADAATSAAAAAVSTPPLSFTFTVTNLPIHDGCACHLQLWHASAANLQPLATSPSLPLLGNDLSFADMVIAAPPGSQLLLELLSVPEAPGRGGA